MSVSTTDAPSMRLHTGPHDLIVSDITEFGFRIEENVELACGEVHSGKLIATGLDVPPLDMEFRLRRKSGESIRCTFHKMEIAQRERLSKILDRVNERGEGSELDERSYDQLASGNIGTNHEVTPPVASRGNIKALVALCLAAGFVGVLILTATFVRLRYTVKVANAVMAGNYLPVNTQVAGEVAEILVKEGQAVRQGDVLVRLNNQALSLEQQMAQAALITAKQEVAAYEKQIRNHLTRIGVAKERLIHQISAATSEVNKARFDLKIADTQVRRMAPLAKSDNIAKIEYEQALSNRNALQAAWESRTAELKGLQVTLAAANKNLLVMGDKVEDSLGDVKARLTIAEAKVKELEVAHRLATKHARSIEIVAPRDGVVYAVYRQTGEYLKVAEEVLAINLPDRSWASGHVAANEAVKIRPGQSVTVSIPSMGISTTGKVAAIGHRAVHGKGGYTAEFRGEAMDVPIKVHIRDLPSAVPAGIRLRMVVQLGLPWNKNKNGDEMRIGFDQLETPRENGSQQANVKTQAADPTVEEARLDLTEDRTRLSRQ